MPRAVTSFGAAATSEHLYLLGGYFGTPHDYSVEGQSKRFARLSLASGQWEELPAIGTIQSVTLNEYDGKLYRVGGMRIGNKQGEPQSLTSVDEFARFDPATKQWQALPPLPEPRSSHDTALVGSKLYVVGGWKLAGGPKSGVFHKTMEVVDLSQEPLSWTTMPAPFERRAVGAATVGERLVVIGGLSATMNMSGQTHIFETRTQTWFEGPKLDERAFGLSAFTLDGAVHASGWSGRISRLSPDLMRWEVVGSLTFPRFFHEYVSVNGGLALALGGISGGSRVRHVETVQAGDPPPRVTSFELEPPVPAKNRQGVFVRGSQLYLFGGNNSLGQHDFARENFLAQGFRLDLGALEFESLVDFPVQRQSMQTIVIGDTGYAIGGFGPKGDELTTHADVYLFDFDKESWRQTAKGLTESRTQFGLVEHDGFLWIFGGLNFSDTRKGDARFNHLQTVLKHDLKQPDSGFVESGFELPRLRRAFAGALLNGKYYMVGGMAEGFELIDEIDVFDFATKTWSSIAKPRATRIGAEMVALHGKLYLAAGRTKGQDGKLGEDTSIEVYDPQTNGWTVLMETLPLRDTHQMRMFPFNDRLLVYTAQREDENVQAVLIDPS